MKNRVEKIVSLVFTIVGVLFLFVGIFTLHSGMSFKENAVEITGEVTDIQVYYDRYNGKRARRYDVYVDYTYNGKEYKDVRIGEYNSAMRIGKNVTLLCDPDHPENVRVATTTIFMPVIMLSVGVVFLLIGIIFVVVAAKKKARQERLLTEGRVLQAVVESIDINTGYRVNGRSPFIIYCTYEDVASKTIYRFKSNHIWNDPQMLFPIGSNINVYVDREDFSKYYVDVDSNTANQRVVDFT